MKIAMVMEGSLEAPPNMMEGQSEDSGSEGLGMSFDDLRLDDR